MVVSSANPALSKVSNAKNRPRWRRRLFWLTVFLFLGLLTGFLILRSMLHGSLPQLEGHQVMEGLSARVLVDRDTLGVPTIQGATIGDIVQAMGFLHAQDRFFQMDLYRRSAAGELAALFGEVALDTDLDTRRHRFRHLAETMFARASERDRNLFERYAQGVNQGLDGLSNKPFEYLILRSEPQTWVPQDSILVALSMYLSLQNASGSYESNLGLLYEKLPREVAEFLTPIGTQWDAPVEGGLLPQPAIPQVSIGTTEEGSKSAAVVPTPRLGESEPSETRARGSNGWALSGKFTEHGGAILANDLHLDLAVPNVWYRVSWKWTDQNGGEARNLTGVSLPGTPLITVGSNGRIAWGFTVGRADTVDLIRLETTSDQPDQYRTPDGYQPFDQYTERIQVRGGATVEETYRWTRWGPVVNQNHKGDSRVLRWVAHEPDAVNLNMIELAEAGSVTEAIAIAQTVGAPAQNIVIADSAGQVGWTLLGRVPKRVGFEGRLPTSWADGTRYWDGWLAKEDWPALIEPPEGRIWSANNRMIGGDGLTHLGDGRYELGARATQIRNRLQALTQADEASMLAIQLDDRAEFFNRWRALLLASLDEDAIRDNPQRAMFRRLVEETWDERASTESAGFRLVRSFRLNLAAAVFSSLTAECREADEGFNFLAFSQWEEPLWRLAEQRPPHLLPANQPSWDAQILAAVDRSIEILSWDGLPLDQKTWGSRNVVHIRHPLSQALPQLSDWLDMEPVPLPGSRMTPRYQDLDFGASMRMVVAPGREDQGLFHMPCGQSGHPFSPFYRAGHEAWVEGKGTPFLPGPAVYQLVLEPNEG